VTYLEASICIAAGYNIVIRMHTIVQAVCVHIILACAEAEYQ
jgi:hypothetical protein